MNAKADGPAAGTTEDAPSTSAQLDDFYRRYFLPLVRRAAWKFQLEKEDARDIVQEAFVIALLKLDPRRNPKAWLIQVVDHLSVNFQRKVQRRARLVSKWSATDAGMASGAPEREEGSLHDADWEGGENS